MEYREEDSPLLGFVGTSSASQHARDQAAISATSGFSVLIRGEAGVGKTHLARCFRSLPLLDQDGVGGPRYSEIDFALLHADEMIQRVVGRVVEDEDDSVPVSGRSTIFREKERFRPGPIFSYRLVVKNLQKATPQMQAYLLTALRDKEVMDPRGTVHSLGGSWQLIVIQRPGEENLVSDLGRALLNGVVIDMTPLRDRPEDIEPLAVHFLRTRGYRFEIASEVIERLRQHSFPENVRELFNVLDHALLQAKGHTLTAADLVFPAARTGLIPNVAQLNKEIAELRAQLEELHTSAMPVKPIWEGRRFSTQADYCFVLMPFSEVYDLQQVYRNHVKPVVEGLGLVCERADDLYNIRSVMQDVWESINRARLVIAEMTDRNPNVFYELGIAHTLGKPVIMIAQSIEQYVPFDLKHLRCIEYQFKPGEIEKFQQALRRTIQTVVSSVPSWPPQKSDGA